MKFLWFLEYGNCFVVEECVYFFFIKLYVWCIYYDFLLLIRNLLIFEWERDGFVYVYMIMLFFVLSINEFLFDSWLVDFFYVCKKLIDF